MSFKIWFLGNMFVFITTIKNMVVKFDGGCTVVTRNYMIINSVSKIYCFASICGTTVNDKNIKTMTISILLSSYINLML